MPFSRKGGRKEWSQQHNATSNFLCALPHCFHTGQKGDKFRWIGFWEKIIQVPVYFLNADFELRNPPDLSIAGRDCIHTIEGLPTKGKTTWNIFIRFNQTGRALPPQLTVCMRSQARSYMDPSSSYVYGFSFGQLLPVRPDFYTILLRVTIWLKGWFGIDEGWIFGEWETGPWLGFRSTEKEAGSYSWLGFGDGAGGDHMVKTQIPWIHSWWPMF